MIQKFDLLCEGEKIGETTYFVISHEVMRDSVIDSSTHNLKIPISETCPCCGQPVHQFRQDMPANYADMTQEQKDRLFRMAVPYPEEWK